MNGDICCIGLFSLGILSLLVGLSVWRRRTVPETGWLALLALSSGLWSVILAFEYLHRQAAFWTLAACGSMLFVSLVCLLFSLRGSSLEETWFHQFSPFFWIFPFFLALVILTNQGHGLFLRFDDPAAGGFWQDARISQGPFFRINRIFVHLTIMAGSLFSLRRFRRVKPESAGFTLMAAAFLPWGTNAFILAGLSPCPADLTPLAFVITGGIIFLVFLRTRVLDMAPFARDLLFREMQDAVLILDSRGRLVTMNPAAGKKLQIPLGSLGKSGALVLADWSGLEGHCEVGSSAEPAITTETSFGDRWFDVKISPIRGIMGRIRGKMLVFRDISARKLLENELLQYATLDPLTEVFNRRMGLAILEKQLRLTERNGTGLSICYVDINNLKAVNDNYGHGEGDFLIRSVAKALEAALRDSDFLCRLGGDEFLMILPDCTQSQGEVVFQRVDQGLQEAWKSSGKPYRFEVARGFAEYVPGSGIGVDELLSRADEEMYRHKVGFKENTV